MRMSGFKHLKETILKIKKSNKLFHKLNPDRLKGKNNPFFGKKHSLKTKTELSLLRKGKNKGVNNPNYENHKMKGYKHTFEAKMKISLIKKKLYKNIKNTPMYGKKHSLRTKKIMSSKRIKWMLTHKGKFIDTDIEIIVKKILNKLKIKFKHPFKIKNHLTDFYLPKYNLIIECDGIYWHRTIKQINRDKQCNRIAKKLGYRIKRFTDEKIKSKNFQNNLSKFLSINEV